MKLAICHALAQVRGGLRLGRERRGPEGGGVGREVDGKGGGWRGTHEEGGMTEMGWDGESRKEVGKRGGEPPTWRDSGRAGCQGLLGPEGGIMLYAYTELSGVPKTALTLCIVRACKSCLWPCVLVPLVTLSGLLPGHS